MKKQLLSKAALCLLCLGAILTACEKKPAPTQETPMPVDITTLETAVWQLTEILVDPTPLQVPDSLPISVKFVDGRLEGHGGCNGFGGSYKTEGNKLTVSGLIRTEMFCEGASKWEDNFLQCLEKSQTFQIAGERLEVMSGDMGGLVFRLNWQKR
jgi:heat shock protein HslJ